MNLAMSPKTATKMSTPTTKPAKVRRKPRQPAATADLDRLVTLKASTRQWKAWTAAAEADGRSLSGWIRWVLDTTATAAG